MVQDHGFARVGTTQVQAIMPPSIKGGHLKRRFRSEIRTRHVKSHCSFQGKSTGKAPSRQGNCHLDRESAV